MGFKGRLRVFVIHYEVEMSDLEFLLLGFVGCSVSHSVGLLAAKKSYRAVAQCCGFLTGPFLFVAYIGASFGAPEVIGVSRLWGIPILAATGYSVGFWYKSAKESIEEALQRASEYQ